MRKKIRKIIITDLTRFANETIVCVAGIDSHNGECIRPIPYLNAARCQELKLLPGRVLSGQFDFIPSREAPHTEDCFYKELHVHKPCSSAEFNTVLKNTCSPSIQQGFKVQLNHQRRHLQNHY